MTAWSMSRRIVSICVLALGISISAAAQDAPRAEVSAGYQLLGLQNDVDETLEKGWYADVAGNFGRFFGVVFQVSGNYKTFTETETFSGITATVNVDLKVHEFMGGVRVNARPNPTVTPFGQFLVGGVNGSAKVSGSVTGGGETFFSTSSSDSTTDFGLQAGGGVNIQLSKRFGVRAAADFIRVFGEDDNLNAFRFAVGAVFPF
jgi:opacity protein-like surface antigen